MKLMMVLLMVMMDDVMKDVLSCLCKKLRNVCVGY